MDQGSESHLAHVHPDLVKVIRAASQDPQPFVVVYGIRSEAAQQQAVVTGHSQTMRSRHLPQPGQGNLACAVDVAALDSHGNINWAAGHEAQTYGQIAVQIKKAAADLNIPVEWGGDWNTFKDWGHWQLPWKDYP